MKTFIAHLHPLLVHLPIGIFLVYLLLEYLRKNEKYKLIAPINTILFFIGIGTAVLSIITGLLNADVSTYPEDDIFWHKWAAIATTLLFTLYFIFRNRIFHQRIYLVGFFTLLLFSIVTTGHLGGVLTHGENYLSVEDDVQPKIQPLQIKNLEEARVYEDLVQYIFNKNCISCHGTQKQKGQLRLDTYQNVLTGGKSGQIIKSGDIGHSEMIRRILLDESDDKHMPPKGKLPLRDFEVQLLKWWVHSGAGNQQHVNEIDKDSITALAIKQFHQVFSQQSALIQDERPVINKVDPAIIKQLQSIGCTVTPLTQQENYYRIVAFNAKDSINRVMEILQKIAAHVVELKLSFTNANDSSLQNLSKFIHLEKLWLDHTEVGIVGLKNISNLKNLKYLNLFNTNLKEREFASIQFPKELQLISPVPKDTLLMASDSVMVSAIKQ